MLTFNVFAWVFARKTQANQRRSCCVSEWKSEITDKKGWSMSQGTGHRMMSWGSNKMKWFLGSVQPPCWWSGRRRVTYDYRPGNQQRRLLTIWWDSNKCDVWCIAMPRNWCGLYTTSQSEGLVSGSSRDTPPFLPSCHDAFSPTAWQDHCECKLYYSHGSFQ